MANLTTEGFKDLAEGAGAIVAALAVLAGGAAAIYRFVLQRERFPHIQSSADIVFIGQQGGFWVVELVCLLTNKGLARHRMRNFTFDLSAIYEDDEMREAAEFGGQLLFPHRIKLGSFRPDYINEFFVDPSVQAKYSFVARVPVQARFLILHCSFEYVGQNAVHSTERTAEVPRANVQI